MTLFNPPAGCANAQMQVNGVTAQVLYENATQVNFVVPGNTAFAGTAAVQVVCGSGTEETVSAPAAPVDPAIFTLTGTGTGQGAIVNRDGTVNSASNPASLGSYISVFGTGFGLYNSASPDGLLLLMYPVTASFGGIPANVAYAGEAPTETLALQQINIQVSANATVGGAAAIMLTSDGVDTAAGLTVAIQ